MRAFLDTSVLVAVFFGDHPHHSASIRLFVSLNREIGCCGAHSLAEVYSTLTRMPAQYRVTSDQALLFVNDIVERLAIVSLSAEEYVAGLAHAARLGITGGGIYDAMLAHCARKADADTIYTWNIKHYERCGVDVIQRLEAPAI